MGNIRYPENYENWSTIMKSCFEDGVIAGIASAHNSNFAKYEIHQCPYEKACHCKMNEPCNGCETWAKYFA